jgi:hypothetical protein
MLDHFSIAICPEERIIEEVKVLKNTLRAQIGWYPSCNSDAHITFTGFEANHQTLLGWEKSLHQFCTYTKWSPVRFNRFQFLRDGVLCLLPDESSEIQLVGLMKTFKREFAVRTNALPHITIARKLTNVVMPSIEPYWSHKAIEISFNCSNLSIRKFNVNTEQYVVHKKFDFGNIPKPDLFALSVVLPK